ncbi:MAG: SoxR reducing system RseC family protein [Mariprofundaceae bacterium]|nr:SoxR reducing system RseC family protein [Mariprofundaceae bacterium]
MRQTSFVTEIDGHEAIVMSERASSCGSCAGKASCHTLGSWKEASGKGRVFKLKVHNDMGAQVGDTVVIEVADSLLLKTAFRLYGVPMLVFVGLGSVVWQAMMLWNHNTADAAAALSGILGVIVYYIWIWKQGAPEGFDARIVAVEGSRKS